MKLQQQTVEDTIESMLTRLDEFQALVDTVRADTSQLDLNLLPQLKKQVPQLLRVFMLIQHLEVNIDFPFVTILLLAVRPQQFLSSVL